MDNIRHSSETNEWGTPSWLVEKCRRVLGNIDLDPCSTLEWNNVIKADMYLDKEYDSLKNPWTCHTLPVSIFINPPGGKLKNKSLAGLYWKKLLDLYRSKLLSHAIWVGFSLEQLATTQRYDFLPMLNFPMCILRERIKFVPLNNEVKSAPSHSNFILYIPCTVNETELFYDIFKDLGFIKI